MSRYPRRPVGASCRKGSKCPHDPTFIFYEGSSKSRFENQHSISEPLSRKIEHKFKEAEKSRAEQPINRASVPNMRNLPDPERHKERLSWTATKEYLNQRGTKIRVFRVLLRAPFVAPFFPHFPPFFPLQALLTLPPLLPSSPPPLSPPFLTPGKL